MSETTILTLRGAAPKKFETYQMPAIEVKGDFAIHQTYENDTADITLSHIPSGLSIAGHLDKAHAKKLLAALIKELNSIMPDLRDIQDQLIQLSTDFSTGGITRGEWVKRQNALYKTHSELKRLKEATDHAWGQVYGYAGRG